jgi:hypothetical protein
VACPAGYSKENEDFNLPTEAYPGRGTGKFNPIHSSASRTCGTEKAVKKNNADIEKEYKKKMMEAQAKGDYAGMQKIAQEMQQKMSQTQMQAEDSRKEPECLQRRDDRSRCGCIGKTRCDRAEADK